MSEKDPSLFTVVLEAFGGWSPGGLAVREGKIIVVDKNGREREEDRFVLLLERGKVDRCQCWEEVVTHLNSRPLPGVAEIRVVDVIQQLRDKA